MAEDVKLLLKWREGRKSNPLKCVPRTHPAPFGFHPHKLLVESDCVALAPCPLAHSAMCSTLNGLDSSATWSRISESNRTGRGYKPPLLLRAFGKLTREQNISDRHRSRSINNDPIPEQLTPSNVGSNVPYVL